MSQAPSAAVDSRAHGCGARLSLAQPSEIDGGPSKIGLGAGEIGGVLDQIAVKRAEEPSTSAFFVFALARDESRRVRGT